MGAMELQQPLQSQKDIAMFRAKELHHLLKLACYALEFLLRIFSEKYNFPKIAVSAKKARTEYYRLRDANKP